MLNKLIISALLLCCSSLYSQEEQDRLNGCGIRSISNFGYVQFGSGRIFNFVSPVPEDQAFYYRNYAALNKTKEQSLNYSNIYKAESSGNSSMRGINAHLGFQFGSGRSYYFNTIQEWRAPNAIYHSNN